MQSNPQVLVKLRNGERCMFNVTSFSDYEQLMEEVGQWFGAWIGIGPTALIRKADILGIFYLGGDHGSCE